MNDGTVVIVTGAARGIGRAIAERYLAEGCRVARVDRSWESPAPAGIQQDSLLDITADLRNPADIDRAIRSVAETLGRIDVLINNAGFGIWKHPDTLTLDEWEAVMETNLRGTFLFSRGVAPLMRQNVPSREDGSRGSIVNIASTRAIMSEPNSEAYAASKGGIVSLTHAMAASYAPDRIRVNCISPGWIETGDPGGLSTEDHRQHWSGRVGHPGDIASACVFLTDSANSFITGTNLVVDGGMTRKMIYRE
jgi:NAD(P)-dependent dehydrogenase (short-subunit alcohol dehydrogenase family)